jgi:hypothetical protein
MAEEIQKWSGVWIKIMPREVRINGIDQIWLVGGLYLIWRILFLIEFLVLELWKQNSLLLWRREEKRRKQKKRWEGKCERGWLHLQPNIWWGFVLVRYLIFHLHHLLHFIYKFLFFILRSSKFFSFQFFFVDPSKVLNSGRDQGRGRVKDFVISAVMIVALRISVVTVWINHNIAQILLKLLYYNICVTT